MSLVGRRRQSAADARRRAARRAWAKRPDQPCAMRGCRRTTDRPLGYCDHCWNDARKR